MERTVYLNGEFLPENRAKLSIFDRSVLFADAVYEVTCVIGGQLLDFMAHMERLKSSLSKLDMRYTVDTDRLLDAHRRLVAGNGIVNGVIYLQVSRGAVDRDFRYSNDPEPTVFAFTQPLPRNPLETLERRLKLIAVPEGRWNRLDIKTTQLLYSSLAKTQALEAGADDAVYLKDGRVTEATASNFFIVTHDDKLVTCPLDGSILAGITRSLFLKVARENGIAVEERTFTLEEACEAQGAFITSATNFGTPVTQIDGRTISDGPGALLTRLHRLYVENVPRL